MALRLGPKRKSLGATATDKKGNFQVIGDLPADYKNWKYIDVTRSR